MLHLGEGRGEAEAPDLPDAAPSPAALTHLLQALVSLLWDQSCPHPQPWKPPLSLLLPQCLWPSILTGPGWEAFGAGQPLL